MDIKKFKLEIIFIKEHGNKENQNQARYIKMIILSIKDNLKIINLMEREYIIIIKNCHFLKALILTTLTLMHFKIAGLDIKANFRKAKGKAWDQYLQTMI